MKTNNNVTLITVKPTSTWGHIHYASLIPVISGPFYENYRKMPFEHKPLKIKIEVIE